jgi:hypothetical protein
LGVYTKIIGSINFKLIVWARLIIETLSQTYIIKGKLKTTLHDLQFLVLGAYFHTDTKKEDPSSMKHNTIYLAILSLFQLKSNILPWLGLIEMYLIGKRILSLELLCLIDGVIL